MSRPVIFDTDMNFGLPGAPIDSGLALLYLLGRNDIDIKGITLSSANEALSKTRDAVSWILRLNSRSDIPIIEGCSKGGEYSTAAAEFLVKTAAVLNGNLTLITTGPLGNIYGASLKDEHFYSQVKQLICSGGLLYPLQIHGWKPGADINFASDPLAAEHVLNKAQRLVLMNMHIGSQVLINTDDLFNIREYNIQLYYLVKEYLLSDTCRNLSGKSATYLWSMLPALYIGNSQLFNEVNCSIEVDRESLEKGILTLSEFGNKVNMPDYITDIDEFYRKMHMGWKMCPFRKWPNSEPNKGVGK